MTLEDDIWARNRLPGPQTEAMVAEGSFRYADGIVHRATYAMVTCIVCLAKSGFGTYAP